MDNYYIYLLNKRIDEILPTLKEAFVIYYGTKYKDKIDKVFSNIPICYYASNINRDTLKTHISTFKSNCNNILQEWLKNNKDVKTEFKPPG